MFDFVHTHKKLIQILLALIILPFSFFGLDWYSKTGSANALATVNGENISQQDFDGALRQQQENLRQSMGNNFDPAILAKPEVRQQVMTTLINQRLLIQQARAAGLMMSDDQLRQYISSVEAFQKNGQFDKQVYEMVVRSQNLTPASFQEQIRDDEGMRRLIDGYTGNAYVSNTVLDNLTRLSAQQRVVSLATFTPDTFMAQTKVDDAAIKAYYDKNQAEFHQPERARVEYVVFSANALLPQITVSDADAKTYYDAHQADYGSQAQRHVAHILISVAANASAADKDAARAKAEQVLQEVKQSPDKFAELAKQYSQATGSADKGGDLGLFQGDAIMGIKSFDDAVNQLKPGEVSGVVQSDAGYHIIKLLDVVPGNVKAFDLVKEAIEQKLKQQKAIDQFSELEEKFRDAVFTQSDSLKPAAELVKVPVQQSAWLNKGQANQEPWTDKVLQTVFSNDVIQDKRNSAVTEIAPNTLLAARMLEYQPASLRPLADATDTIRQKLQREQASALAVKQGKDVLAQLQRGETVKLDWHTQSISYPQQGSVPESDLLRQIFRVNAGKLPAYVGAEQAQGYFLVRVDEVKDAPMDESKRASYAKQLRGLIGTEVVQAVLTNARSRAKVQVRALSTGDDKTGDGE
jgi:peptidyl-prolyl cis-trans isomerase D